MIENIILQGTLFYVAGRLTDDPLRACESLWQAACGGVRLVVAAVDGTTSGFDAMNTCIFSVVIS